MSSVPASNSVADLSSLSGQPAKVHYTEIVNEKMMAMEAAGITTVKSPADMGATVARVLGKKG